MNIPDRKKLLLLGAGACVLLLLADRLVIGPLAASWKDRSTKIKDLEQSLLKGQVLLDRKSSLNDRWDEIRGQALESDAPKAENHLLNSVNTWAADSRFNVSVLKPRWVEDDKLGPRMEMRVSGTGSLEAVSRFIFALETSTLPIRIEDIQLRSRDDAGREISLEVRFSGLTSRKLGAKS